MDSFIYEPIMLWVCINGHIIIQMDTKYVNDRFVYSCSVPFHLKFNFNSSFQCVSADIIFDQLGKDVDVPMDPDHLGELSAVMVYHILAGTL